MLKLALLLVSVLGPALALCPPGFVQGLGQDDCFKLSHYADAWYGAENDCRSKGGHLTSVSSAFANAFLRDQCALWSPTSYWVGASRSISCGSWAWTDGTRFSYKNWARGKHLATPHLMACKARGCYLLLTIQSMNSFRENRQGCSLQKLERGGDTKYITVTGRGRVQKGNVTVSYFVGAPFDFGRPFLKA
jgi:hypothetical protein